jgi:hypothetical protein
VLLHQVMFTKLENARFGIGICWIEWPLGGIFPSNAVRGKDYFMIKNFYGKKSPRAAKSPGSPIGNEWLFLPNNNHQLKL